MKFIHVHYDIIQPNWKVLHVGGGRQPFRRANFVLDNVSYNDREFNNSWVHTIPEHYSSSTWIQQPIEQTPWPFEDEEFDYVLIDSALVCTRDPIAVCNEMERVAKRGYVEVPSVTTEHLRGICEEKYTGYPTHRWIADVVDNKLRFYYKHPVIHVKKDFWVMQPGISQPPYINPNFSVTALFWDTTLSSYEDCDVAEFPDWVFEENTWKHKELIKTVTNELDFWKLSAPVPVLLEESPFRENSLVSLHTVQPKFLISMMTDSNQRSEDMLKFEHIIALRYKKQCEAINLSLNDKP